MCLISVLKKGTEKNSDKVLAFIRRGASSNTHGSGFMYKRDGTNKVIISKGYFNVDKMIDHYLSLKLTKKDEAVFHHRIGTSGGQTRENTHPFVLSTDDKETRKLDLETDKPCLVHNGVFIGLDEYENKNIEMSDTYAFSRYIMSNSNIMNIFLEDRQLFSTLFDRIIGTDKLCILFPDRDLQTYGKYHEDEGYMHSNYGYYTYVRNVGGKEWDVDDSDHALGIGFQSSSAKNNSSFCHIKPKPESLNTNAINNSFQLQLPGTTIKPLTKIVLLDASYVTLDVDNYKHFRYIRKGDWNHLVDKSKAELMDVSDFDINVLLQTTITAITTSESAGTRYGSIPTDSLLTNCYYIPKGNYWFDVYSDYKLLVDSAVEPSKNCIKSLDHILQRSYNKTAQDKIFYKKLNQTFCRGALDMHLKDLQHQFGTGEKGPFKKVMHLFN